MAGTAWLGRDTFPKLWLYACLLFNWVGILALLMLAIAEIVIIANDYSNYVHQAGYNYPGGPYANESPGVGFVDYTNAPRHLGSALWMLFYQISIVILAIMASASDLAWRKASVNEYGQRFIEMFYAEGIIKGSRNTQFYYYVVANGFLKLFIVVLYMSQTFWGLYGGSLEAPWAQSDGRVFGIPPLSASPAVFPSPPSLLTTHPASGATATVFSPPRPGETGVWAGSGTFSAGAAAAALSAASAAKTGTGPKSVWSDADGGGDDDTDGDKPKGVQVKRSSIDRETMSAVTQALTSRGSQEGSVALSRRNAGYDPAHPNKSYGTELWAIWCGWIVLGSIVPSIIAFIFLGTNAKVEQDKSDAEAASKAAKKAADSKKAADAKKAEAAGAGADGKKDKARSRGDKPERPPK